MKVKLLNGEELRKGLLKKYGEIACICYDTDPKYAKGVAKHCLEHGHFSGSRGLYFFFEIDEFSRCCSMQLNRHEVGVMKNQQSQRYVKMDDFGYVIPPSIARNSYRRDLFMEHIEWSKNVYNLLLKSYKEDDGIEGEDANQDARYVLPEATHTKGVWGFTIEALINFMNKRLCVRSQWEIRQLAQAMKKEVLEVLPELAPYLVPQCDKLFYCPEGKEGCKHITKEQLMERLEIV